MRTRWIGGAGVALAAMALGWWTADMDRAPGAPYTSMPAYAKRAVAPDAAPRMRIAIAHPTSSASVSPVLLDRAALASSMPGDTLAIALGAASPYRVVIEANITEPNGNRTVVGRVRTALGRQAMVMTVGANAVFGVLPRPDGGQLRIETSRGETVARVSGGMRPAGAAPGESDAIEPPVPLIPSGAPAPPAAAGRRAIAKSLPDVAIDVLVLVSDELATLRGSPEAAMTEAVNAFAVARQTYVDSGTRVRLNAAKYLPVVVEGTPLNQTLLSSLQRNALQGVDLDSARDEAGADLVAMLRPHVEGDGTCGIAYLNGYEFTSQWASPDFGYSVSNTGTCSTYVLAHELGHNIGSSHERDQYLASGKLQYGAYPFSFGYRQSRSPAFATVMAYTQGEARIGYFSSPSATHCGAPCGITDESDNVASLDLMAPVIAAFRGPPGTLALVGSRQVEGDPGFPSQMALRARLSGKAPAGGVRFRIEVKGGTAIAGVDYEAPTDTNSIAEGSREAWITVPIRADQVIEPDETIVFRLADVVGAPVAQAEIEAILVDDDPRHVVSGRIVLPPGGPELAENAALSVCHSAVACNDRVDLQRPGLHFAFGAIDRMPLVLEPVFGPEDGYVAEARRLAPVRAAIGMDIHAARAIALTGQVRVPADAPPLTEPITVALTHSLRGHVTSLYRTALPPDYRFRFFVPRDRWVTVEVSPPAPYTRYLHIETRMAADTSSDVPLSKLPTLVLWTPPLPEAGAAEGLSPGHVFVQLNGAAPDGGVTFDYRVVDGTARAGTDFVAQSGKIEIAAGQRSAYIAVGVNGDDQVEGDENFVIELSNVSGAVATTDRYRFWITEGERMTGGPSRASGL